MIRWQHYPRSAKPSELSRNIIHAFESSLIKIDSSKFKHGSDFVLAIVAEPLRELGFQVERSKKKNDKIAIPVLFGQNGKVEKAFHADAYHELGRYMLEVEAGRGVTNYQFLKDIFQACSCNNVDSLSIAVRNIYNGNDDFSAVCTFMNTVFSSRRFQLPLKELLIIGY
jgi:hypothetical protein